MFPAHELGKYSGKVSFWVGFFLVGISLREQFLGETAMRRTPSRLAGHTMPRCETREDPLAACDNSFIVLFTDGQTQKLSCC